MDENNEKTESEKIRKSELQDKKDTILLLLAGLPLVVELALIIQYVQGVVGNIVYYFAYLSIVNLFVSLKYFLEVQTRIKYLYNAILYKTRMFCIIDMIILYSARDILDDKNFISLFVLSNLVIYMVVAGNFIYQKKLFSREYGFIMKWLEIISIRFKKFKIIFYVIDILFLIVLYIIIIVLKDSNSTLLSIIIYFIYIVSILYIQDNKDERIEVNSYNINYNDIKNYPLYIYNDNCIKKDKYFKIFKIDLDSIFPGNVTEKDIILMNYACIANESTNKHSTSIYFCMPLFKKDRIIPLEVLQEYKIENKNRKVYKKFKMYIEVKEYNNELLPITIGMIFNVTKYRHRDKYVVNHDVDFKFTYSTNRFISPSILKKGQLLNDKINDDRCFLKHDGPYGNGKTISDIYMIATANRIPVIISPWEENYDHDILYLIFKKIKRATNTKSHSYSREYIIFYLTLLIAGYTFLFSNEDTVSSLLMPNILFDFFVENNLEWIINPLLIYAIYVPLLILFIVKRLIPYIIVFKKDYTKIYQEFFIKEIYKMIQMNSEICLLIEDIDRLSEEAYNNVFRTLSSINKKFQRSNRVIGILSYASDNINDDLLYDLENKICYKEINFSNERHQQKMDIISNVLLHNGVNTNGINAFLSKINDDIKQITFRDLNELIDEYFVKQNHFKVYLFYANLRDTAKKKKEKKQKLSSSPQIQNNIMVNM